MVTVEKRQFIQQKLIPKKGNQKKTVYSTKTHPEKGEPD
jgi:hypothetical protein